METFTIEEALGNLSELMERLQAEQHRIRVTSSSGNIIMVSEETYEHLLVTLEVLATPGLMGGLESFHSQQD